MQKYTLLLFLATINIFATCGDKDTSTTTSKPDRPMESYEKIPVENPISEINIPIRINKKEIEKQLNAQLSGDFYKDNNAADDGLMVRATKRGKIAIEFNNDEIFYRVPVDLWIQKSLAITTAEATGSIDLVFKTAYQLRRNWDLDTKTEVTGFEWTKKPVLKVGFAKIPMESIANLILDKAKSQVTAAIDQQVKNSLSLSETINSTWLQLHKPVELSNEYNTWLLPNPQSLSLSPIKTDGDTLETNVHVQVRPQVYIGEQPSTPLASELPIFQYSDKKDEDFRIKIITEIPFIEAEKMALAGLRGETFSQGNRSVTIQGIEVFGQGNKIVIGTETTGAYNGKIYFKGRPVFSEKRNKIELKDIDFDFSSKKFLLGSLSWLFKGKFKETIQENLDFQLLTNISEMKKTIESQLSHYTIAPGVVMNGNLDDLAVQKVYVTTDAIRLTVALEGKLKVNVGGL